MSVSDLPTVNATLNAIAFLFLLGGWYAIRFRKDRSLHRILMVCAVVASALFLACYLYYHAHAGSVKYTGEGVLRYLYFAILITHIPLAGLMTPFILAAIYFAWKGNFTAHTRITRWLWPVWIYVSVTGVIIYVMLYLL